MIKFRKRDIGCWRGVDNKIINQFMEFDNEEQLFEYINSTLPRMNDDGKFPLHIKDKHVIRWTVLGYIDN